MCSSEDQLSVGRDDWESFLPKEHCDPFLSESSNPAVNGPVDAIHCLNGKVGHVAFREQVISWSHGFLEQQLLSPMHGLRVVAEENSSESLLWMS